MLMCRDVDELVSSDTISGLSEREACMYYLLYMCSCTACTTCMCMDNIILFNAVCDLVSDISLVLYNDV